MRTILALMWTASVILFASTAHAQPSLPVPWRSTDIGLVGIAGHAVVGSNGDLSVAGAGSDIWGTADSFHYVYQPIRDGMITATVASEGNTNAFAKAGVMMR